MSSILTLLHTDYLIEWLKNTMRILISFSGKNFQDEQLVIKYIFYLTSVKPICRVQTSCTVLVLQKKIKNTRSQEERPWLQNRFFTNSVDYFDKGDVRVWDEK